MADTKRTIPETETLNVSHKFGAMTVGTANVPAQGKYLTIVLKGGVPFDMAVSESIEEAVQAHDKFCAAAALFGPVFEAIEQMEAGDLPPDGSMLN